MKRISKPVLAECGGIVDPPSQTPPQHQSRGWLFSRRRLPVAVLAALVLLLALAAIYHYAIYLPQPQVPHRLMLLDDVFALGVFGLVGLVGFALGRRALRLFRLTGFSRLERGALAVGLGWGILSLAVLALGLAQLLYAWLLFAGLGVVLALCWRDAWRVLCSLSSAAPYRRLGALVPQGFFLRTLLAIMILEAILLGTQSLTLPYVWRGIDVYQYHWAVPDLFLLHHAIYALPGWAHANFPFNSEMLNTLALAADVPVAAVYIQAAFGVLAIILITGFLYRHFGYLAAWLGFALSFCNNLVAGVIISGYAEMAATYYGVASLVLVLAWQDQPERSGRMRLLLLAGLLGGFGLGVKYTEGQILVGIGALFVVVGFVRSLSLRRQGIPFVQVGVHFLLPLIAYGVSALLAVLPWLVKDWMLLGNPIYPFVWGGPEWDQARTEVGVVTFAHFGPKGPFWQRLFTGFFLLFRETDQTDEPFAIPPNFLYLLIVLVPVLVLVGRIARWRLSSALLLEQNERVEWGQSWLVVAGVGYLLWLLSGAPVARYALPWVLLLSVPCALLLSRMLRVRWRSWLRPLAQTLRRITAGAILVAAVIAVAFIAPAWSYINPLEVVVGSISLHQWEEHKMMTSSYWHMVDYVEQHVPHTARLLVVGNGAAYFLQGFDYVADSGEDWIPYLETEGRTPAGMVALLQHDHFRYLVYDSFVLHFVVETYGNRYLAGFLPAFNRFLTGSLIQVWNDQTFHVYKVPGP
jgi:hypothetical protein